MMTTSFTKSEEYAAMNPRAQIELINGYLYHYAAGKARRMKKIMYIPEQIIWPFVYRVFPFKWAMAYNMFIYKIRRSIHQYV